ncbi:prephenate dehydrogenase [Eubacterium ventriosum]|uniref:Prephenate dehydrogenase n=1 Tax=Eubacterium ventriosum TaxID=39496 RepID=A0A415LBF4_9FIRM|nr:prephenate dehydrogenase [Eubacterium ventriosum]RHL45850.1 prephenate dehydrogenase [Eubacterium ventriosum]
MREHITFGFVGIGLIGGSVAKALRRVYPSCKIIVYNRSAEPRVMAINDGTANVAVPQVNETFNECDYIFLCTPVEKNVEYLKILKDIIKDDCIITDVGSVKGNIHRAVKELGLEKNFIGGHPMAGSEKTSYTYANDRLVENAYYAITPTDAVSKERVEEFTEIVHGIGAIPINISYEEHDKVVATISHLPHLIAASLVNLVKHNDSKKEYMKTMAAGGFKDITRIASSSPEMWEQICMTNNTNISDMLQKYVDSLLEIKEDLDQHKGQGIFDLISESRDYRDSIEDRNNSLISRSYNVYCDIIDESGAIATIATILATNGVSIKNIGIIHNREFEDGVLKISFYDETSADKAVEQLERHRYNVIKRK